MRIGIDGGGTNTKGVLYKEHEIVDEYIGEMGNPIVNFELAVSNVVKVIEHLLSNNNFQYSDINCYFYWYGRSRNSCRKIDRCF